MTASEKAKEWKGIWLLVKVVFVIALVFAALIVLMLWVVDGPDFVDARTLRILGINTGVVALFFILGVLHIDRAEKKPSLRKRPMVVGTLVSLKQQPIRTVRNGVWKESRYSEYILTARFYTADGCQVTASHTRYHFQNRLSLPLPGNPCLVRYHPRNPQKVIIGMDWKEKVEEEALERAFEEYGEAVQKGPLVAGRVVSTREDIGCLGNKSIVEIEVKFCTLEGREFTASDFKLVPPEMDRSWFCPQESVVLRYHPENPKRIMLLL